MVRICLLVPTSVRTEYCAAPRRPVARLRNRLRRAADWLAWRTGLRGTLHYSTYQDHIDTNRGDSAIRIASSQVLREAFGPDAEVVEIAWFELEERAEWIVAHADLFVIGGGGYYFLDEQGRLAPRVARDVALLRRLRCPVVSLSSGVNQLLVDRDADDPDRLDPATRVLMAECLERQALSSVRDGISRRVLDAVAPGRTVVVADPALFLAPGASPAAVSGIFQAAASQARNSEPAASPADALQVGLNLAFHGPTRNALMPEQVALVAAAMRDLASRRPCTFTYFVHHEAERVIPGLLRHAGVAVSVVDAPATEMLASYARLDLHVCEMLHSSILSLNVGVPTVNLGYDVKNAAFFELMELGPYCVPAPEASVATLLAAMERALENGAALRRAIAARRAVLRQELDRYLASVVSLVGDAVGRTDAPIREPTGPEPTAPEIPDAIAAAARGIPDAAIARLSR